jgi:hypothetical protein
MTKKLTELRNAQDIFDYVVGALLKQGRPAVDLKTGLCHYRMKDGRKCAIGHLIDDRFYSADLEGNGICAPVTDAVELSLGRKLSIAEFHVVDRLQQAHDAIRLDRPLTPKQFRDVLRENVAIMGKWYGLSMSVFDRPLPRKS